jgi:hypothetical protein
MTDEKLAAPAVGVILFKAWKSIKAEYWNCRNESCHHTGFSDAGGSTRNSESLKLRAKLRAINAQTRPKTGEPRDPESKTNQQDREPREICKTSASSILVRHLLTPAAASDGGRTWWAHLKFTRVNIESTIV